jgi:streptomycin 3"-adenylyltransferase
MSELVPVEIKDQVALACAVVERHLASTITAVHLFGSAVEGGLKPESDIDLLVTVNLPPAEDVRRRLLLDLLTVSEPPGHGRTLRPLEVTVISHGEVVPWRYPARRELQFGEWLRRDILSGVFGPAVFDVDLAILLTKARQHSIPLVGPAADALFDPVPEHDFFEALADTLGLWNTPADWVGDERNVMLTLARIWYSAATGRIASKDVAAAWVSERLPATYRPALEEARQGYLGRGEGGWGANAESTAAFIYFAKSAIADLLKAKTSGSRSRR